jgi:hypothetical protein
VKGKTRPVYRACEFIGTVLGWEPDRFMYRAGPVPPGTGRTGPVPTGFANPGGDYTSHLLDKFFLNFINPFLTIGVRIKIYSLCPIKSAIIVL